MAKKTNNSKINKKEKTNIVQSTEKSPNNSLIQMYIPKCYDIPKIW